jgi:type II secretory pathway component PulF
VATRIEAASVTGELADSLKKTAATMQSIADSRLEALPKLLGPISTVIASVVVGVLAMAIMLPSFQMLIDSLKGGAAGAKK